MKKKERKGKRKKKEKKKEKKKKKTKAKAKTEAKTEAKTKTKTKTKAKTKTKTKKTWRKKEKTRTGETGQPALTRRQHSTSDYLGNCAHPPANTVAASASFRQAGWVDHAVLISGPVQACPGGGSGAHRGSRA